MDEIDVHRRGQPEYDHRNVNRLAGQAQGERRLAVGPGPDQAGTGDGGDVGREPGLDHPSCVDRLARGKPARYQKLNIGEPVRQPDLPGLDIQRHERRLLGKNLGLDGFFEVRPHRGNRCVCRDRRGLDQNWCELLDDGALLRVNQPDNAIAAGRCQDLAVGPERDGVNAALRHLDAGNLLHACLVIGVQGSGLRGRAKGHHLFADGLDVLGQGRVELVGVDCHLTRKAVAAAAGGNSLAVGADYHAVDPSRQRRKLADQVGVVADHTRRPAKDPVQLGLAIGAADDNLIPLGVSGHGREPPLEHSGGDRGDIVDEPLRRHLGQLRRHVAADRDQIRSVDGEDRVLGPITMSTQEEHLLTRPGIDRPDRVVATAEGDPGPIGRPARSINRVKCDRDRKAELPLGHVPDLDLAHP